MARLKDVFPGSFCARHGVTGGRLAVALVAMLCTIGAMLLSSQQMSDLRDALPLLTQAMSRLEGLPSTLDMNHVAFFALIGCALRLLLPRVRAVWLLLALAALAVGTELLQFMTDGRTPKVLDVRDDLLGACLGLLMGSLPLWMASRSALLSHAVCGALLVGILLLPVQQWSPMRAFGYSLMPSDLLFVFAISVRTFAWLGGRAPLRVSGFHGWLAAYLLVMLLAVPAAASACMDPSEEGPWCRLRTPAFGHALAKWIGVLYLALLAVMVCDTVQRIDVLRRSAMVWIVAGFGVGLLSLVATASFFLVPDSGWLQPLLNYHGSLPPGAYPRVRATFQYASMFCSFMTVATALLLAAREAGWLQWRTCAWMLSCMLLASMPTLTPELGGIALVLGIAAQRALRDRAPLLGRVALGGAILLALMMLVVATRSLVAPLEMHSQRWEIWLQAWQSVIEHPLRGIGLGKSVVGVAFRDPSGGMQWLTDAHNLWLSIAGQAGVPGVGAFGGLVAYLVWQGWRDRSSDQTVAILTRGLATTLAVVVGYQGLTGAFEDSRHLWVLIGLLAGATMACAREALPRACVDASHANA